MQQLRFAFDFLLLANHDVNSKQWLWSVILNMTTSYFICESQGMMASTAQFADYPSLLWGLRLVILIRWLPSSALPNINVTIPNLICESQGIGGIYCTICRLSTTTVRSTSCYCNKMTTFEVLFQILILYVTTWRYHKVILASNPNFADYPLLLQGLHHVTLTDDYLQSDSINLA